MKQSTHTSFRIGRALLAALALGFAATSAAFASSGTRYFVNDHLATTVGISDAAGEIAAMEADAFGSPLAGGSNAARFTGKPYDDDLGAYVFPFRNYRADEARWMSADPSGFPDGVNGVAYMASPHTEIDPIGLLVTFSDLVYGAQAIYTLSGTAQSVRLSFAGSLKYSWDGNDTGHYSLSFSISVPGAGGPSSDSHSVHPNSQTQAGHVWTANKSTEAHNFQVGTHTIKISGSANGPNMADSNYTSSFTFEVKRE